MTTRIHVHTSVLHITYYTALTERHFRPEFGDKKVRAWTEKIINTCENRYILTSANPVKIPLKFNSKLPATMAKRRQTRTTCMQSDVLNGYCCTGILTRKSAFPILFLLDILFSTLFAILFLLLLYMYFFSRSLSFSLSPSKPLCLFQHRWIKYCTK